jgi:hypothetical protein
LARNLDGSFDIRDAAGTVFTVRSGYANVGRIKIALPQGMDCSDADETACESGEAKLEGPWVSDLLTGKWMPDPGSVRIPIGAYKRLLVRLEAQENAPAGVPDLGRHSLVFAGTFAYAGRPDRPFAIALDFDEDQRFESPSGFAVSEQFHHHRPGYSPLAFRREPDRLPGRRDPAPGRRRRLQPGEGPRLRGGAGDERRDQGFRERERQARRDRSVSRRAPSAPSPRPAAA